MHTLTKVCATLLVSHFVGLTTGCPTWYSNSTGQCECGASNGVSVICHRDAETVDIHAGHCMTFDYHTQFIFVGDCPYGYTTNMTNRMYSLLPKDPTQLNKTTCGLYNREGLLCEHCIEGFGPAVYSTDLRCVNCTDISTGYAIILYLVLELVPITLFFFFVVILHLNITSGPMLGYVIFCQAWSFAVQWNIYLWNSLLLYLPLYLVTTAHVSIVLADVWNLHFFRYVLPSFCLSDRLSNVHVNMLSFFTSVYPVFLMVATYIAINLYARNCRVVHFLWKPFCACFVKFRQRWNTSDSVIHAFATFILLSSYTLTYHVGSLFLAISVHDINGTDVRYVLYYDPSVVIYGTEHLLYTVVAVMLCLLLSICPALLLCLYPTRAFRKVTRCCSPRKGLALKAFAEAIHSCFKNGLNGTRDYRASAGFIILTPFLCAAIHFPLKQVLPLLSVTIIDCVVFYFVSFFLAYLRPCKSLIMNLSLSFHATLFATLLLTGGLWVEGFSYSTETLAVTLVVLPVISHVLILMWLLYKSVHWMSSHYGCHLKMVLTVFRRAAQLLHSPQKYEELHDATTANH